MPRGALIAVLFGLNALVPALMAQEAPPPVDFAREILPIFEQRCFSCHRSEHKNARGRLVEPDGALALDDRNAILRGGDSGLAISAHNAGKSLLFARITLPQDDPEFMPGSGKPLTEEQVALIRRWIDEGAEFGTWDKVSPKPALEPASAEAEKKAEAARVARLRALGEGLTPVEAAMIEGAGFPGKIEAVFADSPLLRVVALGAEAAVDDKALAKLQPFADRIAQLRLGRSSISDEALKTVAKMSRLVDLDLSSTALKGKTLGELAALKNLRTLNLHHVRLDKSALAAIEKLTTLEKVYLYETGLDEESLAALRRARPELKVVGAPELPPPAEEPANPERRPRRQN